MVEKSKENSKQKGFKYGEVLRRLVEDILVEEE
jgi:hypothetical protein